MILSLYIPVILKYRLCCVDGICQQDCQSLSSNPNLTNFPSCFRFTFIMESFDFSLEPPDLPIFQSYRFPRKFIRLYPLELNPSGCSDHKEKAELFSYSTFPTFINSETSSQKLQNEAPAIVPFIPLNSTGQLIPRKNYTFLGSCSLKQKSFCRRHANNPCRLPSQTRLPSYSNNDYNSSKATQPQSQDDINDDTDFNSADLYVREGE